jgi:pyridoxamine 5'-phosphate oxidase
MATPNDLAYLRQEYGLRGLHERELDPDPMVQFRAWLEVAIGHELIEPNGMTISTVDAAGQPWSRIVLLKGCDARGFVFFTNYEGAKAGHLAHEPRCALTFWWSALERQVNITGRVEKIGREETDAYFATRPVGSRIGAWASKQSEVLPGGREQLEAQFEQTRAHFGDGPVPAPEHWGGYVVKPQTVEFWQGQRSRLHDRLRYSRLAEGGWKIERLSP